LVAAGEEARSRLEGFGPERDTTIEQSPGTLGVPGNVVA
jgi:hypothetical protein